MVCWVHCVVCYLMLSHVNSTSLSNLTRIPSSPRDGDPESVVDIDPHETVLARGERHVPLPRIEDVQQTGNSASTLAFIEVIVKRTVNQYMKVICTQPDWFERLLQLVREELNIRSKYNCSTDACIYKIQLFTHYLHTHLMGARGRVRKRVRRSAEFVEPLTNDEVPSSQQSAEMLISPETQMADSDAIPVTTDSAPSTTFELPAPVPDQASAAQPVDDALRLPANPHQPNPPNNLIPRETIIPMIENDSSRAQSSNFGTPDKINMARVSHEVLSEALSKQQRPNNGLPTAEEPTDAKVDIQPSSSSSSSSNNPSPSLPLPEGSAEEEIKTVVPIESVETVSQEAISGDSSNNEVPLEGEAEPDSVGTEEPMFVTIPVIDETVAPASDAPIPESDVFEQREDQQGVDAPWNDGDSSNENSRIDLDLSVQAIPFGQNEFVGKPYENCTGRFENYCFNALKCVYISVLETAACYCRTGYTGVRCDMFNLPQTLDILKSFKEEVIDVPSLRQSNAVTLYSVVEATARYTVNAVLEENLISAWGDDSIL